MIQETISEYQKSQSVRLLDVFVLAPFFVYAGVQKSGLPDWVRIGLVVSGVATFIYNGRNYIRNINQNK